MAGDFRRRVAFLISETLEGLAIVGLLSARGRLPEKKYSLPP